LKEEGRQLEQDRLLGNKRKLNTGKGYKEGCGEDGKTRGEGCGGRGGGDSIPSTSWENTKDYEKNCLFLRKTIKLVKNVMGNGMQRTVGSRVRKEWASARATAKGP